MISVNLCQGFDRTTLAVYMQQGSIGEGIRALSPFPFFDTYPPAQVDALLEQYFGDRFMFSKLATKTIADVCSGIVAVYSVKWTKQMEVLASDYELLASTSKKTTETINKTEARDNTRDDVNKVSAFNTDDLITDTGATSTGADNMTGDQTRTLTESNISLSDAFNNLSLLDKSNILNTVLKDISSYLTLDVY